MRGFYAGGLLLSLCLGAGSTRAQETPWPLPEPTPKLGVIDNPVSPIKGPISGYVRYGGAQGATEVLVRVETNTGAVIAQTRTDRAGRFEFQGIGCGYYVVAADVAGYQPVRIPIEQSYFSTEALVLSLVPNAGGAEAAETAVSLPPPEIPEKARKEFEKGLRALANSKPDESVRHLVKAIEIYPNYDNAYVQLAWAHLQQGAPQEARRLLARALAINEKNARAHALLGSIYKSENQLPQAIEAFEQSLRLGENSWFAHLELGNALLRLERLEAAYHHIARAHELNSSAAATHIALYNALILRDDYQGALAELDEFLKLFPNHPSAARARQQRETLQARAQRAPSQ